MRNPWLFKEKRSDKQIVAALLLVLGVNHPVKRIGEDTFAIIASNRSQLISVVERYNLTIVEENEQILTTEAVLRITDKTSLKI